MASYWTLRVSGREEKEMAWSYETPYAESLQIKGCLAFNAEKLEFLGEKESE